MKARLIEIFASIQGEGLWLGKPQVFVRFHGCRLKCDYCDTPLTHHIIQSCRIEYPPFSKQFTKHSLEFDADQLDEAISKFGIKSLALTGGEPLEQADFIAHWLQNTTQSYEVLLETSGIEFEQLKKVLPYVSLISMDIKLESSSKELPTWAQHRQFLELTTQVPTYLKVVYDEHISPEEMLGLEAIVADFPHILAIVLQPVSPLAKRNIPQCLDIYWKLAQKFPDKVRLVPQVHKLFHIL